MKPRGFSLPIKPSTLAHFCIVFVAALLPLQSSALQQETGHHSPSNTEFGIVQGSETRSPGAPNDSSLAYPLDIRSDDFTCGKDKITIVSAFKKEDEITGKPIFQVIIFDDGVITKKYYLDYEPNPTPGDPMITQGRCVRIKNEEIAILGSTNFGNCSACEWFDIFKNNGAYLGSTRRFSGAPNFKYKHLSLSVVDALRKIKFNDNKWAIEIPRIYRAGGSVKR